MVNGWRGLRRLSVLASCLLLGACAVPWLERDPEVTLAERHCYRTLARVDCHAAPLTGEPHRQVGFFDAPLAPRPSDEVPR